MAQIFLKFVWTTSVFFLLGYSNTYSSQKYDPEPNQFGAFLGNFDKWSAYITPPGEKEATFCHLTKASQDTNKIVASFKYGDQRDFDQRLNEGANSNFKGATFKKIKELLRQVCVLKNANYSIKNAKADFVLCARDEPTGRLVLWGEPGLTKEGFFSVDNKIIDGMVLLSSCLQTYILHFSGEISKRDANSMFSIAFIQPNVISFTLSNILYIFEYSTALFKHVLEYGKLMYKIIISRIKISFFKISFVNDINLISVFKSKY